MVSKEILGGLRLAISKGESLKKAMTTFYNAGYSREEIEEAARAFRQEKFETTQVKKEDESKNKGEKNKRTKPLSVQKKVSPKKVSDYGKQEKEPKEKARKIIGVILIVVALLTLGLGIFLLLF